MARGYSYVQMLLVIALLAILAAASSPYYFSWQQRQQLRSMSGMLLADLSYVQSRAMQREQDDVWGLYIDDAAKAYILFHGSSYSASDPYNQTVTYPNSTVVTASPSNEIVFAGLTGEPTSPTTITITSTSLPSDSNTITINALGVVQP